MNRLRYPAIAMSCLSALAAVVIFGGRAAATAQAPRINLGTLAPRGSIFHQALQTMADQWRRAPGGGVRLVIYPDGTQGGEADMVRLMRVGTLQAGLLTAVGLSEIEPGVAGLQNFPMAFRDFDEFDYVQERLRPMMEKRIEEKGFVMLFWADTGWIRYFFKEKTLTPAEMKRRKIFVWAGDNDQVAIMKELGYNPVPLETADILTGLQTGLINAVPYPPIMAARSQFQTYAPHMLDLKWGILVGGLVIKKDAWDKLQPQALPSLREAAQEAGKRIQSSARKEAEEAVAALEQRGLAVDRITPAIEAEWRAEMDRLYPKIRGRIVPADIFDEVQRLLKEYRAGGGGR